MKNILLILLLAAALGPLSAQNPVILRIDSVEVDCNTSDTFFVPVRVHDFTAVGSFQFSITWVDTTYLKFTNIASINPLFSTGGSILAFNTLPPQVNKGRFAVSWTSKFGGTTVPDGTQIFQIGFVRKGGPFTPVRFGEIPAGIEVANPQGFGIQWDTINGGVTPLDPLPPYVGCPANLTVQASGPTPVAGIAPDSLSDNCEIFRVGWQSTGATVNNQPNDADASGAIFNPGTSVLTYTAADVVAQTDTCSFTVTVEVVNADLIVQLGTVTPDCNQQIAIPVTAQNFDSLYALSFSVNWLPANASFISVGGFLPGLQLSVNDFNLTQAANGSLGFEWVTNDSLSGTSIPNGSVLFNIFVQVLSPVGTTTPFTFTSSPTPQEALSSMTLPPAMVPVTFLPGLLTVTDNTQPSISCPASVTVDAPSGFLNAQVSGLAPVLLTDNCGGVPALTYTRVGATSGSGSGNANGLYNAGLTVVTYTATDQSGNTATCSFTVTVNADLPLVFSLDSVSAICGGAQVEIDVTVQNFLDIIGANFTIAWDETILGFDTVYNDYPGLNLSSGDFQGFATTGSGLLQFLAGNPISGWPQIPNDSVFFTIVFNILQPTSGTSIVFNPPIDAVNGSFNSVAVLTNNGFFAQGGNDLQPPTLVCPDNITVDAPNGGLTALVNGLAPVQLSDDCSAPALSYVLSGATAGSGQGPANGVYNVGLTTVSYTAVDGSGKTANCTFTVTVNSTALTVQLDSVFINCDSAIQTISVDVTIDNFQDIIGLQFSVQWDPAVLQFDTVNNDYPGLNLMPSDFLGFVSTPGGVLRFLAGNAVNGWPTNIPDDAVLFTIVFNVLQPDALSNLVFLGPFDAVDNTFNSVPLVTIDGNFQIVDTTPPVFTLCPPDATQQIIGSACSTSVFVPLPLAVDACSGLFSILPATTPNTYPVGSTVLNFIATDSVGNTATCVFTVTVTETIPPVLLNCPNDTTIVLPPNECSQAVSWQAPTATDNCGVSGVVVTSNQAPGSTFNTGASVVTYTAVDFSGNMDTCSFTITLRDTIAPGIFCPQNVSEPAASALGCAAVVFFGQAFANDLCDQAPVVSSDLLSGDTFPAGINVVTFTAIDNSGNTATCSFEITVTDDVAPTIICPTDLFLQADTSLGCSAIATFAAPQFADACDPMPTLSGTVVSGDTFSVGVTIATFTVSDGFGNTASCNFVINVFDNNAPVLICPDDIVANADTGSCLTQVNWEVPNASDDCDAMPTLTSLISPGDFFAIGTTVVTYTAQDQSGNISTCSFSIQVLEDIEPTFPNGCPDDITVNLPSGCETVVTWVDPSFIDNCTIDTLLSIPASGDTFPTGTTVVVYIVVDNAGNTATCTFNVTVLDQVPPILGNCPPSLNITLAPGVCDTTLTWVSPVVTDNCQLGTVVSIPASGSVFLAGSYTVTFFASDASGNVDTCSFGIVINSGQTPGFVNFPNDVVVTLQSNCDTSIVWAAPLLLGSCDTLAITSNYAPGDTFPIGTTWVVYEGFDFNGSLIRDSFSITVQEFSIPFFQPCPEGPVVVNTAGAVDADPGNFLNAITPVGNCTEVVLEFDAPVAVDNCGLPVVIQTEGPLSGATLGAGSYLIAYTATDQAGNTTPCNIELIVQDLDQAVFAEANPNPGCPGSTVIVTAPDYPGAVYTWTRPGSSMPFPNQSFIELENLTEGTAGQYVLQVDINGCTSAPDTVLVQIALAPSAEDDVINIDPSMLDTFNILLNDVLSVGGVTDSILNEVPGLIDLGNGSFIYQSGENPGEVNFLYEVCSVVCPTLCDMATVTIIVNQSDCGKFPNIITPNNDEVNDYLVIPCLETGRYEENSLVIYNQWGDKVFEASPYSNDPLKAWRGTFEGEAGKDLPDATYFYIFNPGLNQKIVKGFVEIFR